jgi:hypothetical protein
MEFRYEMENLLWALILPCKVPFHQPNKYYKIYIQKDRPEQLTLLFEKYRQQLYVPACNSEVAMTGQSHADNVGIYYLHVTTISVHLEV